MILQSKMRAFQWLDENFLQACGAENSELGKNINTSDTQIDVLKAGLTPNPKF